MEMQVLRCDCCGEIDKIGMSAGGLCQVCECGRVYPAPNAATRAAMEEARSMAASDPRDAEIAQLRAARGSWEGDARIWQAGMKRAEAENARLRAENAAMRQALKLAH